jgi:hypothetical protein
MLVGCHATRLVTPPNRVIPLVHEICKCLEMLICSWHALLDLKSLLSVSPFEYTIIAPEIVNDKLNHPVLVFAGTLTAQHSMNSQGRPAQDQFIPLLLAFPRCYFITMHW